MTLFLNPPKRRRRHKARRKLAGAALAAHLKKLHKRRTPKRRRSRRTTSKGAEVARRRKHKVSRRRRRINPTTRRHRRGSVARHVRRHRRHSNPVGIRGIVPTLMAAVKVTAGVEVGKIATRAIADRIPFGGNTGAMGAVKQVAVGTALALFLVRRFAGSQHAVNFLAGAIQAPLETALRGLNIPVVSSALSAYVQPTLPAGAMAAYVNVLPGGSGMAGDMEDGGVFAAGMY